MSSWFDPRWCLAESAQPMSSRVGLDLCRVELAWANVVPNRPWPLSSRVGDWCRVDLGRANFEPSRSRPMLSWVSPTRCGVEKVRADIESNWPRSRLRWVVLVRCRAESTWPNVDVNLSQPRMILSWVGSFRCRAERTRLMSTWVSPGQFQVESVQTHIDLSQPESWWSWHWAHVEPSRPKLRLRQVVSGPGRIGLGRFHVNYFPCRVGWVKVHVGPSGPKTMSSRPGSRSRWI